MSFGGLMLEGLKALYEHIVQHTLFCLIPAINILVMTCSMNLLGYDLGLARIVGALGFAFAMLTGYVFGMFAG